MLQPNPTAAMVRPRSNTVLGLRKMIRQTLYILGTRHWSFTAGVSIFLAVICVLILAPWIAPYDPDAQELLHRLSGPGSLYWLGTDQLGRDVLSRLLIGGRFSVSVAAIVMVISATFGTIVGVICARRAGGMVDEVIMRTVDLLIAFPDVLVALVIIALIGPGSMTLILSLTVVAWTPFARMARSLTLEINSKDYITAAEVLGCSRFFIVFRHVIPNVYRPLAALTFLRFSHKLITVGALSFLGLGVQPPKSDWGAMLADALRFVDRAPLLAFAPGFAIFITALAVTLIGQGLEIEDKSKKAKEKSYKDVEPSAKVTKGPNS